MEEMLAFRLVHGQSKPVAQHIPIPSPKPDEVLVKIVAAGVCHTDHTLLHSPEKVVGSVEKMPTITLGHEGAGVVEEIGTVVQTTHPGLTRGTRVALLCNNACYEETCEFCCAGNDNLCSKLPRLGLAIDGTWASYTVIPARSVVPIPEGISSEIAAIATDAIITPLRALKAVAQLQNGQTVLVMGCGGLGLNAIQIAKYLGAGTVIGYDRREDSLARAKEAGADYVATPDNLVQSVNREDLTPHVILDLVASQATLDQAMSVVKPGGKIVLVGQTSTELKFSVTNGIIKAAQILCSMWGTKADLEEAFQAIVKGKLTPKVQTRYMGDCPKVLQELDDGQLVYRAVLVP
ncbi:alcohol dehydogenase [Panus rudis PR-1116 ss-1]|nr:alcohol dehydogenase [Panus rudis PR-1116 ss-1]